MSLLLYIKEWFYLQVGYIKTVFLSFRCKQGTNDVMVYGHMNNKYV